MGRMKITPVDDDKMKFYYELIHLSIEPFHMISPIIPILTVF